MQTFRLSLIAVALFAASGANCAHLQNPFHRPTAPAVLSEAPTLGDVTAVVNANSGRVRSLKATGCRVSAGWMPSINADIALERPRRFRLRGQTSITGPEVDIGSNDELLWSWARLMQPAGVYYIRHADFYQSMAPQMMPIDPDWIPEAFGLATFATHEQHQGPNRVGQGRLEIRTMRQTAGGLVTKLTVVEDRTGHVLEQHLYNQQGQNVLSVLTTQHELDVASGAWIPKRIELKAAALESSLKLKLENVQVNSISPNDVSLWSKPEIDGYPNVDIGRMAAAAAPAQPQVAAAPTDFRQPQALPAPPGYQPSQPQYAPQPGGYSSQGSLGSMQPAPQYPLTAQPSLQNSITGQSPPATAQPQQRYKPAPAPRIRPFRY